MCYWTMKGKASSGEFAIHIWMRSKWIRYSSMRSWSTLDITASIQSYPVHILVRNWCLINPYCWRMLAKFELIQGVVPFVNRTKQDWKRRNYIFRPSGTPLLGRIKSCLSIPSGRVESNMWTVLQGPQSSRMRFLFGVGKRPKKMRALMRQTITAQILVDIPTQVSTSN
jgi:hypothetical protein